MSRARTKLLSGAIAIVVGAIMLPLLVSAVVLEFARAGMTLNGLLVSYSTVVSGFVAYEAFRRTFNALCERWSNDPVPPRIEGWRIRRDVVRTT